MGHAIERIALERGHEIVARIDVDNRSDFDSPEFKSADVAIEFTIPAMAVDNYIECFKRGVKVVSGTTAWTAEMPRIKKMVEDGGNTFFWTSNFSIGVNIFFALNRYLSRVMNNFPQYTASMKEIHHIHKLDHPSGTAITLADGIIDTSSRYDAWTEEAAHPHRTCSSSMSARGGPGTHIIKWDSPVDTITIEHRAKSRDGFALGAVVAAEWVKDHTGFLTMEMMMGDLLK